MPTLNVSVEIYMNIKKTQNSLTYIYIYIKHKIY